MINLPSRPDKRDDLILGSSVSDFHLEFIDGVTPDQISPQSYPYVSRIHHSVIVQSLSRRTGIMTTSQASMQLDGRI